MNYNNYSISASKGKLYLKEKQPTEGYEEITYGVNNDKKTYHKYFNSIKGTPKSVETKEIQFDGRTLKFLEFTLADGEDLNKVSLPLKNKSGYTDEVKTLISALNGLEVGEEVTFSPSLNTYTNKKGEEKKQLQIYINYVNRLGENGKGLSTGFIPFTDIPKPTSEIVAGDTTWDWRPQTEFYYEKLNEIQARFQNSTATQSTATPTIAEAPSKAKAKNSVPQGNVNDAFEPLTTNVNTEMQKLPF